MKIFVTDKYRILTFITICSTIAVCALFLQNSQTVTVSENIRLLPIYSVERDDKAISVTFDCAWGADDIDTILSILSENNCPSTFFMLGTWAEKHPDAVKKIVSSGHELGNHSYNHILYTTLSSEEIKNDIKKCNDAIYNISGINPVLFRAPSGDYNNSVVAAASELNLTYLQWDTDSLDYRGLSGKEMLERINSKVRNGSILLFHNDTPHTAESLDMILKSLFSQGYKFVKGSELIYKDNYIIDHTGRQIKQ